MIENYINTVETIRLHLYHNGQPSSADALPTVTAEDFETGDPVVTSVVSTVSVTDPVSYDYYEIVIAGEELTYNRKIKVTWDYVLDGEELQKVEIISVVQPYFFADDLWTYNSDFALDGPDAKSIDEVKKVESLVRGIIDAYTRQSFQKFGRKQKVYLGSGSDELELNDRIYKLWAVDSQDVNFFQREPDESVSNDIVTWNSDSPYLVYRKLDREVAFFDIKADISPGLIQPRKLFKSGTRYTVDAEFGWERVPIEVKQAAIILANDYFCEDDIYHQKNITVVRSADFRMEFGADHHSTTGNVYADQLLSNYVDTGVTVI